MAYNEVLKRNKKLILYSIIILFLFACIYNYFFSCWAINRNIKRQFAESKSMDSSYVYYEGDDVSIKYHLEDFNKYDEKGEGGYKRIQSAYGDYNGKLLIQFIVDGKICFEKDLSKHDPSIGDEDAKVSSDAFKEVVVNETFPLKKDITGPVKLNIIWDIGYRAKAINRDNSVFWTLKWAKNQKSINGIILPIQSKPQFSIPHIIFSWINYIIFFIVIGILALSIVILILIFISS